MRVKYIVVFLSHKYGTGMDGFNRILYLAGRRGFFGVDVDSARNLVVAAWCI